MQLMIVFSFRPRSRGWPLCCSCLLVFEQRPWSQLLPGVLSGKAKSASVWDEELFLPLASSLDKVLDLLNRTSFY